MKAKRNIKIKGRKKSRYCKESAHPFIFYDATAPSGPWPLHYRGFTTTLIWHTTLGRTPLESAQNKDLYITTHITHKRQISMFPAGFEPAVPESERPQIHALDRAETGIGADSFTEGSFLASGIITPDAPKCTTKLNRVVIYQRLQMKWHRSHLDTDLF